MSHPAVQIAMRYLHLVSVACLVGGMVYAVVCLAPAARALDDASREPLLRRAQGRFRRLFWLCAAGLLVSGTYTWVISAAHYRALGALGEALIGTKVLLALLLFAVMWAGSAGMIKDKACLMICVHLAAVVMLLAAVLRYVGLHHAGPITGG